MLHEIQTPHVVLRFQFFRYYPATIILNHVQLFTFNSQVQSTENP